MEEAEILDMDDPFMREWKHAKVYEKVILMNKKTQICDK
jgi:hypothetical protein